MTLAGGGREGMEGRGELRCGEDIGSGEGTRMRFLGSGTLTGSRSGVTGGSLPCT